MKLQKQMLRLSALMLVSVMPAFAQVERVAMKTTGISCGVCAAVSEINFRRLASVDKVTISRSSEAIMVSYKPGSAFHPQEFRDLLKPLEVGIAQFQISAKGRLQEQGGNNGQHASPFGVRFHVIISDALYEPAFGKVKWTCETTGNGRRSSRRNKLVKP